MGMYSTFSYENINVLYPNELNKFLKNCRIGKYGSNYKEYAELLGECSENIDTDEDSISFSAFTNMKIIAYWYNEMSAFFRDIAVYLDGEIHWTYENEELGGYIEFEDGKCILHTGTMQWDKDEIESVINAVAIAPKDSVVNNIPDEVKKMKLARSI